MFGKSKAILGLDIGSSAVKAVELKPVRGGYRVTAFATEPVPPEAIVDGAVVNAGVVAAAVTRAIDRKRGFRAQKVCAGVSGNAVIVKKISLPVMSAAQLAESIAWEAEQYIPFAITDVHLDYQVLDPGSSEDGRPMDVLLVAAKKEKVGDYTSVITQAGATPVVVDVDAFALQNAFEANYGVEPSQVVALLNVGASGMTVNIIQGGQSVFTRDTAIGGNAYTEALQRELNLPFDAAEQLKRGVPVDGATFDNAQPVLHAVTENVLLEIQKTFDFFRGTTGAEQIDRIVLSGGASLVDGLHAALEERFGVAVERFDPFRSVTWDTKRLGHDAADVAASAAVAVGLALRQAGDK